MIDRDTLFRRWVRQEPAPPNVQYLRDEERAAALAQLGHQPAVLDVASESTVTAELDADSVTRVDFSEDAAAYAGDLLDGTVDRSVVTSPESPELPFEDDSFPAAVSLGPFDWKFLDVEALVAELHRVLADDGILVFSVPTPRSPYSNDHRNRYYEPTEALALVSPDWRVVDHDQIFQYPALVNGGVNSLPAPLQEPFVDVERAVSGAVTDNDLWSQASYLVLGVRPLEYRAYLDDALACLFRPVAETGFWDGDAGTFVRAWEYDLGDDGPTWTLNDSVQWRYAPLALAGVMRWRTSPLGDDRYDGQIRRALAYFSARTSDPKTLAEMPSYGLGPLIAAFSLAADAFGDGPNAVESAGASDGYAEIARALYEHTASSEFSHAEDSLLLWGWTYLYEHTGDEDVLAAVREALWTVNEWLTSEGLFGFENPTARRHQNQMYALWGLCRAIEVTGSEGFLSTAERVLEYTVEHRLREDGAFIWEDRSPSETARSTVGRALLGADRPPHWAFLYACHQTFFVNAVEHYYAAGGTDDYDTVVRRAMAWVYGDNDRDLNLVEYSGLGVPMRFLLTDGRMDVPDQQFKGAYEVGSYVMALTSLVAGEVADGADP